MTNAVRRILGNLVIHANRTVAEVIRERGGNASNVRHTGTWAAKTLLETAEAAIEGDLSAARALKIVKQAKRLGEEH
jgi:hypothetical protein